MNIIQIRDSTHREMYLAADGWNLNRRVAREFNTPLNAIAFIIQHRIDDAELVIHSLGAGLEEVTVPMKSVSVDAAARASTATGMNRQISSC